MTDFEKAVERLKALATLAEQRRAEERAAWARLVKAEVAVAQENAPCPGPETLAERDAARRALCDLNVALLEDR